MEQEPIYPESLRKFTPIIAALAIVLLVVFFFLPKSAASVMGINPAKVTACCVNAGNTADAALSDDESVQLLQLLQDARVKSAAGGGNSSFPAADYVITVTSGAKTVSTSVSREGYLYLDNANYQIKRGGDELITFLQEVPVTDIAK